jgi:hypothetical protein
MHKLKEMLMNELYEYEEKAKKMSGGKLSVQELEKIHKLTDTVKNIDKIELLEEGEGYSEDGHYMGEGRIYGTSYARGRTRAKRDSMGRYSRDDGMSYDRDSSYNDGMSYARGSMRGGRMGYSRDGAKEHLIEKAEEMYDMASDEKERRAIKHFIKQLEDD